MKAALILAAHKRMGVDAMAVGDLDLKLGVQWLKEQAAEAGTPFLSANLVTDGIAADADNPPDVATFPFLGAPN